MPRVVAIGDVHGSYKNLVRLLKGADLVDGDLGWAGGDTHLVVAGDFLDRGGRDREVMDLLIRLQREARDRVHVLLGNHEVLNLQRDTRHVNSDAYRAFAADEAADDRRAAWAAVNASTLGGGGAAEMRREFMRRYPPGYFARQRSLAAEGEYGSWLLRLPTIIKINDVVYTHGGLTAQFAQLGIDEINRRVRLRLEEHVGSRDILEAEGLVSPEMTLPQIIDSVERTLERPRKRLSPAARVAAELFLESAKAPILRGSGPLWYRGSSTEDERIERQELERSLELLGARALVVAHSYTGGNRITSRFGGRLYRVDNGIFESKRPLALVVENGEALVLDPESRFQSRPIPELPTGTRAGWLADNVEDQELVEFLAAADVVGCRELGRGSTLPELVVLEKGRSRRRGIFKTVNEVVDPSTGAADRYQHEVAAYRLDRRLHLDMVPATVVREIDDRKGSLQSWVEGAIDRQAAGDHALPELRSSTTVLRLAEGRVFDALIGNGDRQPGDVLFVPHSERVMLVDHSRAFSTSTELGWNEGERVAVRRELAARLRSLDRDELEASLGDLLTPKQLDALFYRRDEILRRIEEAAESRAAGPRLAAERD